MKFNAFEMDEPDALACGFHNEPGWTGAFTRTEAKGALPNGTPIRKLMSEPGDAHPVCSPGVVLGSIAMPPELTRGEKYCVQFAYFVEWAARPKVAVGVMDYKIADATPLPPFVARFDPNDERLIKAAWALRTQPGARERGPYRNVIRAISRAVRGFHWRLFDMHPDGLPTDKETGEMELVVAKPATFFDDFAMRLVMEDICNATGKGMARKMWPNAECKGSPDVVFV